MHQRQRIIQTAVKSHTACPTLLPALPDVDIDNLPRRRTDNARILDRNKYTIKLYTSDGGTKLLRRPGGKVCVRTCWMHGAAVFVLRWTCTAI